MDKLKEFVEGKKFSGFILVTIIINSIVLGLQTSSQVNASIGDVLSVIDTVCRADKEMYVNKRKRKDETKQ